MKNGSSDITVVLDRSGSMSSLSDEVIGAFNSFVDEQKQVAGTAVFSLVQFDDQYEVYLDAVELGKVGHLDRTTYVPRGLTALYDAVGTAIVATGKRLAAMDEAERPEKIVFLIQTDGAENASSRYDGRTIQAMIRHQREKYAWEFVFLGANIDAIETARHIGIDADHAADYCCDSAGTAVNYECLNKAVTAFRRAAPIGAAWKKDIEEDYKRSKK